MKWKVISTKIFSKEFKKHKKNNEFVDALDKKIERLKSDPENVGGYLSGKLHGYKSTRIIGKFRLIFKPIKNIMEVQLSAIDNRKFDYKNFSFED